MLVLKRAQRAMFADKLPDAANLAMGALVFGQFLGDGFSSRIAVLGLALWAFFMGWAAVMAGGVER